MEREHADAGSETTADDSPATVESSGGEHAAAPEPATIAATRARDGVVGSPSNTLTIVGRGRPSSFEITVDGDVDLLDEEHAGDATIVSGSTVEGTIETGTLRFRFTGDLADVTFVDRGITGVSPGAAPNVHVDYARPEQ